MAVRYGRTGANRAPIAARPAPAIPAANGRQQRIVAATVPAAATAPTADHLAPLSAFIVDPAYSRSRRDPRQRGIPFPPPVPGRARTSEGILEARRGRRRVRVASDRVQPVFDPADPEPADSGRDRRVRDMSPAPESRAASDRGPVLV